MAHHTRSKDKRLQLGNTMFPVLLEEEPSGGYVVVNPALEGCYSQGETIAEALENITEATKLCLEDMESPLEKKNISLHFIQLNVSYDKVAKHFRKRTHQKTQ